MRPRVPNERWTAARRGARVLAGVEQPRRARGERAQLLGVLQAPRLLLEPLVLARGEARVLDLLDDVAQVVGAALRLGRRADERAHLLAHRGQLGGGLAHPLGVRIRAAERVEDAPLRLGVEERLGLVLAVEVDEQPADLGEHARRHGRAVGPRARRPPAAISRLSTTVCSSTSTPRSSSSSARSSRPVTSNVPSTLARSAPVRIRSVLARSPRSRPRAPTMIDLPAPVSPRAR
jgi:hypothetical protein